MTHLRALGLAFAAVVGLTNGERAFADDTSDVVARILAAAEQRTRRFPAIYAEFVVREHISPAPQVPENFMDLQTKHMLVFNGDDWRFDWIGDILHSREQGGPQFPRKTESTFFKRAGAVRRYTLYDGETDRGRAQVNSSNNTAAGYFNSAAALPAAAFARFLETQYAPRLRAGEFVLVPEESTADLVRLRHSQFRTQLYFDSKHDYLLVRTRQAGVLESRIEYAEQSDVGYAPIYWSAFFNSPSTQVEKVAQITGAKWHTRLPEIESLLAFDFPSGTKVVDTDKFRTMVADQAGNLTPIPKEVPARRASLYLIGANILVIAVLAYLVFRQRRLRGA